MNTTELKMSRNKGTPSLRELISSLKKRKSGAKLSGFTFLFCLIGIASFFLPTRARAQSASLPVADTARLKIAESYGKLPLSFEANYGQTDSDVKFLSRGSGYSLFLTSAEAVLALNQSRDSNGASTQPRLQDRTGPLAAARGSDQESAPAVLHMKLVGGNPSPQIAGVDELPGNSNYFIGNDQKKWRTNVPTYAKVKFAEVYPGIDLVYYGNQRQLEYDFVVSPGADPRAIRLTFPVSNPGRDSNGATTPQRIDPQGDLLLGTEETELRLHRPVIYQEISGTRQGIGGNFVISDATAQEGGREVGFEVARYDASKPLIIDPVLSYSTYFGGGNYEFGSGIAVDSSGNAYVTGYTSSINFPTANAFQAAYGGGGISGDAFVTKFNASGSALVYSTYLGGSNTDIGYGIAVDSSGNAYVTGQTQSTNFPTVNPFQPTFGGGNCGGTPCPDAFVAKLNASGSVVYSTYLGGSGQDNGGGIAVDSSGNAYVTGGTASTNFPTANAFQVAALGDDAFVTKLNAAGSALVYSTYLGGGGRDLGHAIAVDPSGNAYVTGFTGSTNFPTANPFQAASGGGFDAFLTKLNAAGSALIYSTYLGGRASDYSNGIAVDSSGSAYVTGRTDGDFPTVNAFQATAVDLTNAFVAKFNAAGSALVYSTYLGGGGVDEGHGIAVDSSGNAYVTGMTASTNFPTANAFQSTPGGVFVTKFPAVTAGAPPVIEPQGTVSLSITPGTDCPGFYIAEVNLRPGYIGGFWGLEILLSAGDRLLQGGINLGGEFSANGGNPGFAAFNIANANNEPQNVNINLNAQVLSTAGINAANFGMSVQIFQQSGTARTAVGAPIVGLPPFNVTRTLGPGFYVVNIQSLSGSPAGTYQLSLTTSFTNRTGGAFQGGVDLGGMLIPDASGNMAPGFGAFCISPAQNVSLKTGSAPTYPGGAGAVTLRVLDQNRRVVWDADTSPSAP